MIWSTMMTITTEIFCHFFTYSQTRNNLRSFMKADQKSHLTFLVSSPLKWTVIVRGIWPFGTCSANSWILACKIPSKMINHVQKIPDCNLRYQIYIKLKTSWNFRNFDALSWRTRFPFVLFILQRWDGHSNKGMKTRAVTSCLKHW